MNLFLNPIVIILYFPVFMMEQEADMLHLYGSIFYFLCAKWKKEEQKIIGYFKIIFQGATIEKSQDTVHSFFVVVVC